ncbi:metacaspase-2-like [Argiope bruennichi]|uniref:metacaspase-2-like n=1 Tax=Argiope bruennichi TaxID=94029 RepID=UPI002493DFA6|nr:metacaspase-2-like [Argiope bruennichi]XP_055950627.1 metacaspase-2-like [Argiope bruennichi]
MDKAKSSKGVIKVLKHEKQVSLSPPFHSMDKNKNFFKVEENDFPSLSEVLKKNPKSGKDSSSYNASSFTYSSKLKTLSAECSSQYVKFENLQYCEPKLEFVSSKALLKNESPLGRMAGDRHMTNAETVTKESIYAAYNVVPTSNKKSNSKLNASSSEGKNNKSECFNQCTNAKTPYGRKSVNDNRSPKTAHSESNTFEKTRYSPKITRNLNNGTTANAQRFPFSQSLSNPRKTNSEHSTALRNNVMSSKESDRPVINAQHKRLVETNRSSCSKTGIAQDIRLSERNIIHSKASGSTSNKTRIPSNPANQMAYSSVKPGNNKAGNQSLNAQSSLIGPSETKKKKKRKSKLKRQAALQTGKILFLTPEVHSKIVSQSNNICLQKNQNILTNINDSEEYPELGLADSKTVKKSYATASVVHTKEENPTDLVTFGSETTKENLLVSKDSSASDNLEAAAKLDEKHNDPVEKPDGEKSSIHSNNPITLSLFDMLVTAKPRKKEPEKKDESTDENNASAKIFKKEMIKKNISQAVNPLASSKPTIKRGKEREKPKVKRPSRMRKLIVMEKQLRKETAAMMTLEAEDENQEKSEEVSPRIHDINEFSADDNLETYVENLLNYVTYNEKVNETCDIYDDVNNKTSEHLALSCEDADFQSNSKNQNVNEQSKLNNEILNKVLLSVENHMTDFSNYTNTNVISDSVANIENDFVENTGSNSTDNEKKFEKDLVDINTVEESKETCSSAIRNFNEKYLELNSINDPCCIDENLTEDGEETKTACQIHNFLNRIQESDCKITDMTKKIIPSIAGINTDVEFNSEKGNDSTEKEQSSGNFDSFEKVVSGISSNSFSDQERLKATKLMLHSRKFRQYCNHFISKEIDQAVYSLIDDLARFQDRMYQKDPVKAKIRRRLVYGIKEIKKHMKLKKVKCIIIATDIEDIKIEGGLNDSLRELISLAEAYHIPYVFSHRRFNLGKVCRKSAPVSCVGIFNYEGSEKNFKKMLELHEDSKHDYFEVTKKLASELTEDQVKELFEAEKESVLSLREASQKILREKVYFTPEGYRNYETSELLENSASIEPEDSIRVPPQQSEDSYLHMNDEKSSSIEECSEGLKKLDRDENLLQPNGTDINTILVKYKVVKEG